MGRDEAKLAVVLRRFWGADTWALEIRRCPSVYTFELFHNKLSEGQEGASSPWAGLLTRNRVGVLGAASLADFGKLGPRP